MPGGGALPVLGLGTWRLGEDEGRRAQEVATLREALDLGYRLIDTAEMYGEGGAETVVGQAVAQALRAGALRREELTIVSKVYPHNASRKGTVAACERSLRRLGLEHIDLYLLHWRGEHPLRETCAAMCALVEAGRIGRWGVSNFDTADLEELLALPGAAALPAAQRCAANQVYYSLGARGVEFELLARQQALGLPLMAYSPIDQGALAGSRRLQELAQGRGLTAAQLALAWVLRQPGVLAIPKAARSAHLRENLAAAALALTPADCAQLDREFPPPRRRSSLAMR
jgi:diketogulonate reductase-like aldo/keto reductase